MELDYNESSSELNMHGGKKDTKFTRFLESISPALLREMKKYLVDHLEEFQYKSQFANRILLYEDIYTIVQLKESEEQICLEKGKMRDKMLQIAQQLKRKHNTIDQRMRKKISQLTPEQLKYCMETNTDITCKGNSKQINTSDWPEHLRIDYSHKRPQRKKVLINLDSEQSQSQMNQRHLQNQQRMNEPEERNHIQSQPLQKIQQIEIENESKNVSKNIINSQQKPNSEEQWIEQTINKWNAKNLETYTQSTPKLLAQSQICYNIDIRQYLFINPQIVINLSNKLLQESIRRRIKNSPGAKNKQKNKITQNPINEYGQYLQEKQPEDIQQNRVSFTQQTKQKSDIKKSLNQPQTNTIKTKKIQIKPLKKTKGLNQNQAINIDGSLQKSQDNPLNLNQSQQRKYNNLVNNDEGENIQNNSQKKATQSKDLPNTFKILEQLSSKYDINQLPRDIQELFFNGLKVKDEIQKRTKHQYNNRIQQQTYDTYQTPQPSQAPSPAKPMLYWFNNDSALYQTYQQDIYGKSHLMWSQQQDQSLQMINQNFQQKKDLLQTLIKYKTPQVVYDRIKFLNMEVNSQFNRYMKRILLY